MEPRRGVALRARAARLGLSLRHRRAPRAPSALGLRGVQRIPIPVVSLGNLTVGGTGKTPAALWLAEWLRARGERPVIVTRGYGGDLQGRVVTVGRAGQSLYDPREIGDEAVLLAERFNGPVVCGADRVAAAKLALEEHAATVLDPRRRLPALAARRATWTSCWSTAGRASATAPCCRPARCASRCGALKRADAIIITKATAGTRVAEILVRYAPNVPTFAAELAPRSLVGQRRRHPGRASARRSGRAAGGDGVGDRAAAVVLRAAGPARGARRRGARVPRPPPVHAGRLAAHHAGGAPRRSGGVHREGHRQAQALSRSRAAGWRRCASTSRCASRDEERLGALVESRIEARRLQLAGETARDPGQ